MTYAEYLAHIHSVLKSALEVHDDECALRCLQDDCGILHCCDRCDRDARNAERDRDARSA